MKIKIKNKEEEEEEEDGHFGEKVETRKNAV